jgi:hypothetical protein
MPLGVIRLYFMKTEYSRFNSQGLCKNGYFSDGLGLESAIKNYRQEINYELGLG